MPNWCTKHKMHTIDESCPGCERGSFETALTTIKALLSKCPKATKSKGSSQRRRVLMEVVRILDKVDEF